QDAQFAGQEVEPNNTPAEAQRVPFGEPVSGQVGKRIDPTHGDIDFYAIDVPTPPDGARSIVSIKTTSLPNFATCTFVYKKGFANALAQYCTGAPKRALEVPAIALEPGRYLFAVKQDLDDYGGIAPLLHENVSDRYTLEVGPSHADASTEVEPNDQIVSN